jgi:hypothetical protein
MRAYRYLDNVYGPRLAAMGLFGISTLQSVGLIEGRQRDEADGVAIHGLNAVVNGDEPGVKAALSRHGIIFGNQVTNIAFIGGKALHRAHGYICCLSENPESKAFPGKDWVFEIRDVENFMRAVIAASDGRLPRIVVTGRVDYSDAQYDAMDIDEPLVDPMIKSDRYSDEEEFRLFWPSRSPVERFAVIDKSLLDLARLIRRPAP